MSSLSSQVMLTAYLPEDRRRALARGAGLPEHASGAVLFADISGFTALTEALARDLGPKRGAEALTGHLLAIFDALISRVGEAGGSVIQFGGDALTCWFGGDDGLRAAACGLAMQAAMRGFGSVTLPSGGTVSLAMKAAVAAGSVRRFLVGEPHIQQLDVLAGALLDEVSATEHDTRRGEVGLSPATAAGLAHRVAVAEWRETEAGRLAVIGGLAHGAPPAAAAEVPPAELPAEALRPWLLGPVYERVASGQEQFLAEIRPTVSLFLRFGGIDYDADPGAGRILDGFLRWAQGVLAQSEGFLLQVLMGDKGSHFYAAFGAPVAHDDDPKRAVSAALELSHPPPDLGFVRDIRIGISRGRTWAGAYGGTTRRTYGILGDAVNLSARLMAQAAAGQILVSQSIADAVGDQFLARPVGLMQLKGKQEPQAVFEALGPRSASLQSGARLFSQPLFSRDRELAEMGDLLGQALSGAGQVVRVEGAAGLGKSHLVAEFARRAEQRGARVLLGACQSTTQRSAYAPWRPMLRAFFDVPEGAPPEAVAAHLADRLAAARAEWSVRLPLLGDLLGLSLPDNATTAAFEPRLRQEALFALTVDLVQHWARLTPLVLVVDDAHWMDEASQGLTLALARGLTRARIMLVLVQRPPFRPGQVLLPDLDRLPGHRRLELTELPADGITALAADRLRGPAAPLTLAVIQSQAQGNPFFATELINALRESGHLQPDAQGIWRISAEMFDALQSAGSLAQQADGEWTLVESAQLAGLVPDSIQGIVLARIDSLPEAHKLTLKVASVIGRVFALGLLARSHPAHPDLPTMRAQADLLEVRDFTLKEAPTPDIAYMFKHNITLEVAYDTLLEAQQRELHRAVGTVLESVQPEAVEQLAYHFSRSGDRVRAMRYLEQAARKAQHRFANETALNYFTQALALEERAEWRQGEIEVLHILGRRDEEKAALELLQSLPNAPAYPVAALWGQYYESIGDYARAQAAVERALSLAQDPLSQTACLAQLGLIARRQGDYEPARDWYRRALALFAGQTAFTSEEAQAYAAALNGLGVVHRQQGQFAEAKASYERALELSRQHGNRRGEAEALNALGATEYYQRNIALAIGYYRQAIDIRKAIGDRAGEGTSLFNLATATRDSGDYGQAEQHLYAALTIQQATGNRWEAVNVWNGLGGLYQELGVLDKAQQSLEQGLALSRDIGDEAGQAYLLANLGLVARDRGQLEQAEAILHEGLALARQQDDKYLIAYFFSYLGSVYLRAGRPAQASDWARQALAMRRAADMRLFTADDLATLASADLAAGDLPAALARAEEAWAILEACAGEGPEFPHQDYFFCYQVFSAAGQEDRAQAALRAAHRLVAARAERITEATLRASFLQNVPIHRQIMAAATAQGSAG